jgi:hypothetical protein
MTTIYELDANNQTEELCLNFLRLIKHKALFEASIKYLDDLESVIAKRRELALNTRKRLQQVVYTSAALGVTSIGYLILNIMS